MLRQTTSRSQRAKGFKVKQALQILLLIAICIWLLYQVKHSHDKKRALDEKNLNFLSREHENQVMPLRFGRKDLPGGAQIDSTSKNHDEEEEKEEKEEPEEEEEQELKQEDPEDEDGRAAGDDVIDDKDQYRGDEEAEQGEESPDEEEKQTESAEEEKLGGESADEEEKVGGDSADDEEKQGEGEEMDSVDDQDKERDSQQAREEHYRRDDVAGSVLPDTHMTNSESDEAETKRLDNENTGGTNEKEEETENLATGGGTDISKGDKTSEETVDNSKDNLSGVGQRENETMLIENASVNATAAEKNELEGRTVNSEGRTISNSTTDGSDGQIGNQTEVTESGSLVELHSNSTTATVSDNQLELQTNATAQMGTQSKPGVGVVVTHNSPLQNGTTSQDSGQNNETTVVMGSSEEHNSNPEHAVTEHSGKSNMSAAVHTEDNSTDQNGVSVQETENNSTSLSDVHLDDDSVLGQPNKTADPVITEEEKEARTDLSTLADAQTIANTFQEEAVE